jgi:hypothetical protein
MKKLLLLFTTLLLISCSSEDSDDSLVDDNTTNTDGNSSGDNSGSNQTFLEKYDGYKFELVDETSKDYIFFNNDDVFINVVETTINDYYSDIDDMCTTCQDIKDSEIISLFGDDVEITIVENVSERLILEFLYYDEENGNDIETIEFTVSSTGNSLTLKWNDDPTDTEEYVKTNTNFSSLCENNDVSDCSLTFLERFDGVGFSDGEDYNEYIYYFFDEAKFLKTIEGGDSDEPEGTYYCSEYSEGINDNGLEIYIIDNNHFRFEVEINTYENGERVVYYYSFAYNQSTEELKEIFEYPLDDGGYTEEIYYYSKIEETYSSFCN